MADITLRFEKTKEHTGASTPQKTDADGKPVGDPAYGYSMSFGSKVHMKAYLKDGDTAFYTAKTEDSKAKAGMGCVNEFTPRSGWRRWGRRSWGIRDRVRV